VPSRVLVGVFSGEMRKREDRCEKALQENGVTPIAKPALDLDALADKGASLHENKLR